MFYSLFPNNEKLVYFLGIIFVFLVTFIVTGLLKNKLPRDGGREFAIEGALSAGKPRGAGIIFILSFALGSILFARVSPEILIYLLLVVLEMLTGFFDDAAEKPWGELKKGILDLLIALGAALTFVHYNGSTIVLPIIGVTVTLPAAVYVILAVILIWAAINVANCTDGVDGLSATLVIITLFGLYIAEASFGAHSSFSVLLVYFAAALLSYLYFNATPSILLMGDAGSRAMGIFIAIAAMKIGAPLLFIPFALVMIVDGGIGLFKVAFIRVTKIRIMKNLRTPLHDHARKVKEWSNTQTVFRFAILQIIIVMACLYLIK